MIELYTWTTPNGYKPLILLEELGLPYRLHWIDITKGAQQTAAYTSINPNQKIPAIVDDGRPIFESGAIAVHLAERTGKLLAPAGEARDRALAWTFFAIGGPGPMFGQYGHFAKFAEQQVPYAIARYHDECLRLLRVLDGRLAAARYLAGDALSIADFVGFTWPRAGRDMLELDLADFRHVRRWIEELEARPATARALALKP